MTGSATCRPPDKPSSVGRSVTVAEPAVVDIDDVIGLLPALMVRTVRFNGAREAVRLRVSDIATPAPA